MPPFGLALPGVNFDLLLGGVLAVVGTFCTALAAWTLRWSKRTAGMVCAALAEPMEVHPVSSTGDSALVQEVAVAHLGVSDPAFSGDPASTGWASGPASSHCPHGTFVGGFLLQAVLFIAWRAANLLTADPTINALQNAAP